MSMPGRPRASTGLGSTPAVRRPSPPGSSSSTITHCAATDCRSSSRHAPPSRCSGRPAMRTKPCACCATSSPISPSWTSAWCRSTAITCWPAEAEGVETPVIVLTIERRAGGPRTAFRAGVARLPAQGHGPRRGRRCHPPGGQGRGDRRAGDGGEAGRSPGPGAARVDADRLHEVARPSASARSSSTSRTAGARRRSRWCWGSATTP